MILLLVLLCACESDDGDAVGNGEKLIRFEASIEGKTTKGSLIASAGDLREFGVMAHICSSSTETTFKPYYFRNLKVARTSSTAAWTYSPAYYWPGVADEDHPLKFVAYSPMASTDNGITINEDGYEPKITYSTPENIKNQPDLLATDVVSSSDENSAVALPFKHLLTSHRFVVGTKTPGTAMIAGLTITKIEFVGIKTGGYFQFTFGSDSKPTWTLNDGTGTRSYAAESGKSLFVSSGTEAEEGTEIISEKFMFLPQTIAQDNNVYVKIHCTYNNVAVVESKCKIKLYDTLGTTKQWVAGKTYTYYLTFSGQGIGFEVSESQIKDWGNGGEEEHETHNW